MASITYIDEAGSGRTGYFGEHKLSKLISSLLEPENPSEAFSKIARLIELLLLSNHIDEAYSLTCAVYKHFEPMTSASSPPLNANVMEYFWQTHPTHRHPLKDGEAPTESSQDAGAKMQRISMQQWHAYRECTRTGWMLEHCKLPEPEDPHAWRETDDAAMIAMCSRLLAKDKTPGEYPPQDQLREALSAAQKLYAQPQVPVTEWSFEWKGSDTVRRHSYLLYRRLVAEIAIRVGELQAAADILSVGLRLDGFNHSDGGQLDRYLFLPGIYEVLPILAAKGKEGNPFFIEENDAIVIVQEIIAALELRAREGRQWSLAPEKVGWEELLGRFAEAAWAVNRKEYENLGLDSADDILYPPASEEEIAAAEAKVGELPADFKEMVRIANGFEGGWHFLGGGIDGIDNIRIADEEFDDISYGFDDVKLKDEIYGKQMIEISPATECDGFRHFILPPATWQNGVDGDVEPGEYRYWQSTSWGCGSDVKQVSIREWVAACVEEFEEMVEEGRTMADYEQ
ncbi:hypothetical protein HJFPF1_11684 [Paramyrothecium foliicola]|nr:hypothetical protein HJFPF1_11684 [Paramyrothecium foliicola]